RRRRQALLGALDVTQVLAGGRALAGGRRDGGPDAATPDEAADDAARHVDGPAAQLLLFAADRLLGRHDAPVAGFDLAAVLGAQLVDARVPRFTDRAHAADAGGGVRPHGAW